MLFTTLLPKPPLLLVDRTTKRPLTIDEIIKRHRIVYVHENDANRLLELTETNFLVVLPNDIASPDPMTTIGERYEILNTSIL
jgi:hypothetical protein